MKFQLVTLIAALSLIAPVLASPAPAPHYDDKPAHCDPHKKIDCPWGYVCCHDKCYKGDKCPKKDDHKKDDHKKDDHKKDDHKKDDHKKDDHKKDDHKKDDHKKDDHKDDKKY